MDSRRDAMKRIVAATMVIPIFSRAEEEMSTDSQLSLADLDSADRWMQSWIEDTKRLDPSASKAPNGALHLGRFADPMYYLTSTIGWNPNPRDVNVYPSISVPIGFVTDFASIPRIFWSALRPDGLYSYSAVIHDYLYWEQFLSREDSDAIFKLCMEDFGIAAVQIAAIYSGVRLGGSFAWDNNAKLKADGEKRILKRTPSDPTVRWADWKVRRDVY